MLLIEPPFSVDQELCSSIMKIRLILVSEKRIYLLICPINHNFIILINKVIIRAANWAVWNRSWPGPEQYGQGAGRVEMAYWTVTGSYHFGPKPLYKIIYIIYNIIVKYLELKVKKKASQAELWTGGSACDPTRIRPSPSVVHMIPTRESWLGPA